MRTKARVGAERYAGGNERDGAERYAGGNERDPTYDYSGELVGQTRYNKLL